MEPRARRSRNWVVPEQPPERHEGFARVVDQEPVVAHYARNPNSALVRLSDFLSSRQLRNLALYSEHYGPLGRIEDTVPIVWHAEAGIMNAFGLLRHSKFSDKERAIMEFLRPHLIQAHANALEVSKINRSTTQLQRALEVSARALVVLKHDHTIKYATQLARDWMHAYLGAAGCAARLPEPLDLWVRQHDSAMQQILELPRPRDPLVITRDHRRLIVRLLSSKAELMLLFEEQNTRLEPESLHSLGLTRRENEVLASLANGRSKTEIARILALRPRTVDTHLQHIYERLGVSTRNAAVAKAFCANRIGETPPPHEPDLARPGAKALAKECSAATRRPIV
jgi:DNA-binding CsgD family transcriptional regulator